MAYDGTHLALMPLGSKSSRNIFCYTTTDAHTTVDNTGHFTDGYERGMQVGDIVYVIQVDSLTAPTSVTALTMHAVSASSATTGVATIAAASTTAATVSVKADGTTAPVVGDDTADGYSVGSIFVDTTNKQSYSAQSVATGAAIWPSVNNDVVLSVSAFSLVTAATVARFVAPFAGRIKGVFAVVNGTVGGTNKAVTLAISGSTVTSGGITISKTSVPGTVASATTITTANTIAAGNQITLTSAGTAMSGSKTANFFVVCRRGVGRL